MAYWEAADPRGAVVVGGAGGGAREATELIWLLKRMKKNELNLRKVRE